MATWEPASNWQDNSFSSRLESSFASDEGEDIRSAFFLNQLDWGWYRDDGELRPVKTDFEPAREFLRKLQIQD